jgi:molybdate transport system substrate-binding protein
MTTPNQAHHAAALRVFVLSGGAANGLVTALAERYQAETGMSIGGSFGAVGAMRDKLLAKEPADLLILTKALIVELERSGHAVPGSAVDLGIVRTAIAVRSTDAKPDVATPEALKVSLATADEIYFPDPKLATAGIHFAKILDQLGLAADVAARLKPFPNGQTAMRAMSQSTAPRVIGCTQVTEILSTPGVTLVAALPKVFELATVYTAAVATRAASPDMARRLARLLTHAETQDARQRAGFETA